MALGAGLLLPVPAGAQADDPVRFDAGSDWDILIDGQLRPRFVAHSGLDFLGGTSEWRELVTQRARLGTTVEHSSGLNFAIQLQDVRIWGEEDSTLDASAAGFDVHQAYAVLPLFESLEVKLGRQEITFDDQRLVGNRDWAQRGRAFDGGRLTWSPGHGRHFIDLFYAKVQEAGQNPDGSTPPGRAGDKDFGGVHASLELFPDHVLSPVYLVNVEQAPGNVRHTIGASGTGSYAHFSYAVQSYYQYGKMNGRAIEAYLVAAHAEYRAPTGLEPSVLARAEVLSGDGTPQGTFDTLYATNHKFYGEMDFFLDISRDTQNLGLVDLGGQVGSNVVEGLRAQVDYHHFRSVQAAGDGDHDYGHELDFKVIYRPMTHVTLRALYGVFIPRDAMRTVKGYGPAVDLQPDHFVYLTTDVSF